MKTTLNQIREKSPCANGWKKLLAHLILDTAIQAEKTFKGETT